MCFGGGRWQNIHNIAGRALSRVEEGALDQRIVEIYQASKPEAPRHHDH